ncbi:MAG: 50S ribosomal protein L2 [Chitinophagales bacterium]|nr:50S ribosomal protein L2 [Chitinophagales bacterium]MCO5280921.1 50S ribosomal protein L2 [Chitinophagales bacterium]OJV27533.1 MAG: 50S ribosomal protein L2 [Bacteroidetes bacterium 37-13]HRN95059.1 50S ribosomal protein L2 [Chitinophagales bacterium]HRP39627.1 50S ribosomal protein L2 [Chitinophagales bacterium]
MGIKKYKPTTPSMRFTKLVNFEEITTNKPEKSLLGGPQKSSGGRNSAGRMTVRYVGGGHKKRYRIIDFKRDKFDIPGKVASIEYDPNRTSFIALIHYPDGEKRYILAPAGLKVGQTVVAGSKVEPEVGNTLPLGEMPVGVNVHNVEMQPGRGGVLVRSAGASAQLQAKEERYVVLKMPSGETRRILRTCLATIGILSNGDHNQQTLGKAGRNRWLGRRPHNRGVVMNPVDHPMGGGEGRASGGHPRSRTGLKAKGLKTRSPKKASSKFIIQRRKAK